MDSEAVRPVGPAALMVEVASTADALALAAWARGTGAGPDAGLGAGLGAVDVVPGARTVLLDGLADVDAVRRRLAAWEPPAGDGTPAEEPTELVELPVTYHGPDLDDVARLWGMDRAEAVAAHAETTYVAAFGGFAPGFAYLGGLPERLAVPRLARPRPRVPPGSVGVADTWTGVYPSASPGGWRLLGHTDAVLWDATREPPALLAPGTGVRFVPR